MSDIVIKKVQTDFLKEAKSSPMLLADLANMESYISESYQGRSLIELLQNADDAGAKRFCIKFISDDRYIAANDGRPFDNNDVIAMCRSGASTKKRKGSSIGFRGIGFKSVVNYAEQVNVISGSIRMTFSKRLTHQVMGSNSPVPLIRIPHVLKSEEIDQVIKELAEDYNTVFEFKVCSSELSSEIEEFEKTSMLFLNNVEEIELFGKYGSYVYKITRTPAIDKGIIATISVGVTSEKWIVYSGKDKCSVAFSLDESGKTKIITDKVGVVHSFMPTKDACKLALKINGDFSTDPSRTKVTMDDESKKALDECADIIADVLSEIILLRKDKLDIINTIHSLRDDALKGMKVERIGDKLISETRGKLQRKLSKKIEGGFKNICICPGYLDDSEFEKICKYEGRMGFSSVDEKNIAGLFTFLKSLDVSELSLETILAFSEKIEYSEFTKAQLVLNVIRKIRFGASKAFEDKCKKARILVFQKRTGSISSMSSKDILDANFYTVLRNQIPDEKDLIWFFNRYGIKISSQTQPLYSPKPDDSFGKGPHTEEGQTEPKEERGYSETKISRYRTAKENIEAFFNSMPNVSSIFDMSNPKAGYDFEMVIKGNTTYVKIIETKCIGDAIVLSPDEYNAAVKYGKFYAVAVVEKNSSMMRICLVANPMSHMKMDKRIVKYEWLCTEYEGNMMNMKFND